MVKISTSFLSINFCLSFFACSPNHCQLNLLTLNHFHLTFHLFSLFTLLFTFRQLPTGESWKTWKAAEKIAHALWHIIEIYRRRENPLDHCHTRLYFAFTIPFSLSFIVQEWLCWIDCIKTRNIFHMTMRESKKSLLVRGKHPRAHPSSVFIIKLNERIRERIITVLFHICWLYSFLDKLLCH